MTSQCGWGIGLWICLFLFLPLQAVVNLTAVEPKKILSTRVCGHLFSATNPMVQE